VTGYNVMILWSLIELVSVFQNIYAKPTILCWHWWWLLPECLSSSVTVVLLHPKLRRDDNNVVLFMRGTQSPKLRARFYNQKCCDRLLNPGRWHGRQLQFNTSECYCKFIITDM